MDQSTEIKLMKASNSTDPPWNEELDDVLNVIALDESSQRSSAVQPAFDEERHFYQDLSTFQMSSCQQRKEQNQYVSTASPRINVQSTCSVPPLSQHLKVGQADSSGGANVAASSFGGKRSREIRAKFQAQYHWKSFPEAKVPQNGDAIVVPSPTVTDSIEPNSANNTLQMGCAVFGKETSSFDGKSSKEIHAKLQAQNHGNSSPETKSRMQSSSKLFGILSLIFQAFDCPLTTELEERYVCALQRALVEIQNARSYSQKSQEQEI